MVCLTEGRLLKDGGRKLFRCGLAGRRKERCRIEMAMSKNGIFTVCTRLRANKAGMQAARGRSVGLVSVYSVGRSEEAI